MLNTSGSQFTGELRSPSSDAPTKAELTTVVAADQAAMTADAAQRAESSLAAVTMVLAPSAETASGRSPTEAVAPAELILAAPIEITKPAAIPNRLSDSSFQEFDGADSISFRRTFGPSFRWTSMGENVRSESNSRQSATLGPTNSAAGF